MKLIAGLRFGVLRPISAQQLEEQVGHLGANDPYKQLKTALKAEIDEDAWSTLYRDTSRPFPRPSTGKIAVKVINHFGDEVMKVFGV